MIFQQFNLFAPARRRQRRVPAQGGRLAARNAPARWPSCSTSSGLARPRPALPRAALRRAEAARRHRPRAGAPPSLLLADEATSALDPRDHATRCWPCCARVNRELGVTIVLITHEMDVIARIADRVAVMDAAGSRRRAHRTTCSPAPQTRHARRFVSAVAALAARRPCGRSGCGRGHRGRLVTVSFPGDGVADRARALGRRRTGGHPTSTIALRRDQRHPGPRRSDPLTFELPRRTRAVEAALAGIGSGVHAQEVFA